jgi:hypothetical protein
MANRETKVFKSVGSVKFDERKASGIASPFYELDRHGDMMLPGCYKMAGPAFADAEAVVMLNHGEPLPIGICTNAEEVAEGLAVDFVYHSHAQAADARSVAKERQDMGKGTGLSVGIRLSKQGWEEFENGQQLLNWLEEEGHDISRVKNLDKIRAYSRYCYAIKKVDELFEFSQVCVGAAPSALATQIKNVFGGDKSLADLPTDELMKMLLAGVGVGVERLEAIKSIRAEDGRKLGGDALANAKSLRDRLDDLLKTDNGATVPDSLLMKSLQLQAEAVLLEIN